MNKINFKKIDPLFFGIVIVPTILMVIYYGFIASDEYVSESKFVIRSPSKQSASSLNVVLQNIGFNSSSDDSYVVRDFLTSRDAVRDLEKQLNIREKYSKDDIDVIGRFGSFFQKRTFENFYEYFIKKAEITYDPASGISKLRVYSYIAEDAKQINETLLEMSESLINKINDNAKKDILSSSEKEVNKAKKYAVEVAKKLASYRMDNKVFNPEGQSMIVLQEISKLQDTLIQSQTQLAQARLLTPDNPQIEAIKLRIKELENAIKEKSEKITGKNSASLSNYSADYQLLQLEKEISDKQLVSAMAGYEQAKVEFNSKQLYLERLAYPSLPDEADRPNRLKNIVSGFIFGLLLWGVVKLFVVGVKEHND